ncbi:MAG: HupE/UreJ family protein [Gemmatimonadales bacterium]|nr:HupE/UreJ family protein [Gemmatimonadales bacterium]
MRRLLLALLLAVGVATSVRADEFRPAYLQLVQRDSVTYDVLWKVPALDENTSLAVRPEFPAGTEVLTPVRRFFGSGTSVQRWRIRVPGGLVGRSIGFTGLAAARIDILVRVARSDGSVQLGRVLPVASSFAVEASPGPLEVVSTYTRIGIEHILLGVDHLLFVLALVMIVRGRRMLLLTITSFTVAHSITLALATMGVLRVPGPPVEAIIALSIVFVAVEILRREQGREDLATRKPWIVAFTFGLLHGLGFAGALAEVGLPDNAIPLALLFFNVGVEIGQLLFVAALLLVGALVRRLAGGPLQRRLAVTVPAYAIGALASYWVVERISKFWS